MTEVAISKTVPFSAKLVVSLAVVASSLFAVSETGSWQCISCDTNQVCCQSICRNGSSCLGHYCGFDGDCSGNESCCSNHCMNETNCLGQSCKSDFDCGPDEGCCNKRCKYGTDGCIGFHCAANSDCGTFKTENCCGGKCTGGYFCFRSLIIPLSSSVGAVIFIAITLLAFCHFRKRRRHNGLTTRTTSRRSAEAARNTSRRPAGA